MARHIVRHAPKLILTRAIQSSPSLLSFARSTFMYVSIQKAECLLTVDELRLFVSNSYNTRVPLQYLIVVT